ncbi:class I SAM-dependent methyltransferase [Halorutilales archaeon Cl-col2-1]
MPKTDPFDEHTQRYDDWFERHPHAYAAEVEAVRRFLPDDVDPDRALEVGVGTGRFADSLGMGLGLDPSRSMLSVARSRGIESVLGVAENLPFRSSSLDVCLIVTTVCFVDSIPETLEETRRVLRDGGAVVLGYIDRESPLGGKYEEKKDENPFYADADFVSTREIVSQLEDAGFGEFDFAQTLFNGLGEIDEDETVEEGYGDASFVALRGVAD